MIRGFTLPHISLRTGFAVFFVATLLGGCVNEQYSAEYPREPQDRNLPSLVVTNEPPPSVIYRRGSHDTVLANPDTNTALRITPLSAQRMETAVTRKVADLTHDFDQMEQNADAFAHRLQTLQDNTDTQMAGYYALVASINADLQTGTTLGNPILVDRWNNAQDKLNAISDDTSLLNTLAMDLSEQASKSAYLLDQARATFGISGAVDEDHRNLTILEDRINQNVISANRLMTQTNDALNRRAAYLRTERANLQALSLAISNGEMHGQSLTNSVFKKAMEGSIGAGKTSSAAPATSHRPLVIIRFDKPNVNYDQPLYTAVSQALEKYPSAKFDLVAVSSSKGSTAAAAIAATEARKNGEAVLRSLTQMGLPMERINLNAANSKEVLNSEVQLYIQ